jgi:hypothetical protein
LIRSKLERPDGDALTSVTVAPAEERSRALFTQTVRATAAERIRPLPGDDLIHDAMGSLTHAVSIARPPRDVWPWLAQMGAGRAGWYSYDRLDNGGRPSANGIHAELQHIGVGTLMPALPGQNDGFVVVGLEPGQALTLGWPKPGGGLMVTWTFVIEEQNHGTRLIVRARGARGYRSFGLPERLSGIVIPFVHFVMQRKQLIGIARRAEAAGA